VQRRLDELAVRSRAEARALAGGVQSDLGELEARVGQLRTELASTALEAARTRALEERLHGAESRLAGFDRTVEEQATTLSQLSRTQERFGPDFVESELDARDARLLERWRDLETEVAAARDASVEVRRRVEDLDQELSAEPDLLGTWRDVVGPVVQLASESSVGSGVLLSSRFDEESDTYRTYLITAWHVIRDIQGDLDRRDDPIPVAIYGEDGSIRHEGARLLCNDERLDAALLELETPDELHYGAALAGREHLAGMEIFDEIYAVGCPLGNDPIPTRGEIATCRHEVDGETYWMINAPTYIGNSGGGIFDVRTHELVGIFSKIYTHGTLRPTIVPHMGLVTPLGAIYDWLETTGYADVEPTGGNVQKRLASAPR